MGFDLKKVLRENLDNMDKYRFNKKAFLDDLKNSKISSEEPKQTKQVVKESKKTTKKATKKVQPKKGELSRNLLKEEINKLEQNIKKEKDKNLITIKNCILEALKRNLKKK